MNQTLHNMSPVGVGIFHNCFPPSSSIGIIPNPTHPSHQHVWSPIFDGSGDWFGDREFRRAPSERQPPISCNLGRDCFVIVHPIFSNFLDNTRLVYNIRGFASSYLTTVSRGNISFTSPLDAPADNYNNDYLAWGGNKKNAKIPSVNNYLNDFYNYKKILIKKIHKLFSSVNNYLTYFYNYKKNYKLFVTLRMGVL